MRVVRSAREGNVSLQISRQVSSGVNGNVSEARSTPPRNEESVCGNKSSPSRRQSSIFICMPRRAHWIKYERAENYSPLFIRVESQTHSRLRFEPCTAGERRYFCAERKSAERDLSFCLGATGPKQILRRWISVRNCTETRPQSMNCVDQGWREQEADLCPRLASNGNNFCSNPNFCLRIDGIHALCPMSHLHWVGTHFARVEYCSPTMFLVISGVLIRNRQCNSSEQKYWTPQIELSEENHFCQRHNFAVSQRVLRVSLQYRSVCVFCIRKMRIVGESRILLISWESCPLESSHPLRDEIDCFSARPLPTCETRVKMQTACERSWPVDAARGSELWALAFEWEWPCSWRIWRLFFPQHSLWERAERVVSTMAQRELCGGSCCWNIFRMPSAAQYFFLSF